MMIKENRANIEGFIGQLSKDHPARERFSAMLTPYKLIREYLKECKRYDSRGNKI